MFTSFSKVASDASFYSDINGIMEQMDSYGANKLELLKAGLRWCLSNLRSLKLGLNDLLVINDFRWMENGIRKLDCVVQLNGRSLQKQQLLNNNIDRVTAGFFEQPIVCHPN